METSEQKYQNVELCNIERPVTQWVNNRNDIGEYMGMVSVCMCSGF